MMKMNRYKIIVVAFFIGSLVSCKSGENNNENDQVNVKSENDTKESINLNLSIFIDLSDHLDTIKYNERYLGRFPYQNFIDYSKVISQSFAENLENSKTPLRLFNESIQIYMHPYPNDASIQSIVEKSSKTLNKDNTSLDSIKIIPAQYEKNTQDIIRLACNQYTGTNGWPGSNIYEFMKKGEFFQSGKKNTLVIFTDGYPYHKNNNGRDGEFFLNNKPEWKLRLNKLDHNDYRSELEKDGIGLSNIDQDYTGLNVLILGIRPSSNIKNPYEKELIEAIWSNWFQGMKVDPANIQFLYMEDTDAVSLSKKIQTVLSK